MDLVSLRKNQHSVLCLVFFVHSGTTATKGCRSDQLARPRQFPLKNFHGFTVAPARVACCKAVHVPVHLRV